MSQQTVRRVVMTVSVAAITATGAWYGAGLKTQKQAHEVGPTQVTPCPIDIWLILIFMVRPLKSSVK